MKIESSPNYIHIVCESNIEKMVLQGLMHQIKATALVEDNSGLTEKYVYYDANVGVLFAFECVKSET